MHAAASTGSPFGRTSAAPGNDSGSFSLEELMGRRASPQAVSVSPGRTPPQVSSAFGRTLPPKASDARVDASSPGKYDSPLAELGEEADAGGGTLEGAATQAQEPDSKNAAAPLAPDPEHLEGTSNDAMWLQLLDGEDSDDNGGSGAW
ncbi:hypothetical protein FNF28_03784 [Cafeteria roenbergensis]|uniref:Uncharacterized protein n=1 Tax=Cafeteria roenbergensis TaxID=33653 RepID=A0A5A8DGQ4_CAFRO|nr:hypothetical protein FNF28_03784 [Cafeteria roenbergensis]